MIRRHGAPHHHHVPALAGLPDQVACTLRDSAAQYLVTVFGDPDHVILDVKHRVRALPVLNHPPILVERLLEAHRLKGGGLRPGEGAKTRRAWMKYFNERRS